MSGFTSHIDDMQLYAWGRRRRWNKFVHEYNFYRGVVYEMNWKIVCVSCHYYYKTRLFLTCQGQIYCLCLCCTWKNKHKYVFIWVRTLFKQILWQITKKKQRKFIIVLEMKTHESCVYNSLKKFKYVYTLTMTEWWLHSYIIRFIIQMSVLLKNVYLGFTYTQWLLINLHSNTRF